MSSIKYYFIIKPKTKLNLIGYLNTEYRPSGRMRSYGHFLFQMYCDDVMIYSIDIGEFF
jgi:hypothetical protein